MTREKPKYWVELTSVYASNSTADRIRTALENAKKDLEQLNLTKLETQLLEWVESQINALGKEKPSEFDLGINFSLHDPQNITIHKSINSIYSLRIIPKQTAILIGIVSFLNTFKNCRCFIFDAFQESILSLNCKIYYLLQRFGLFICEF
jgi:hypothetical protein